MSQIRPLSPALAKVARSELDEVPSRIDEDIQNLRTWINTQAYLKARTDDQFLVAFLRGCKYSLEKSKQKIEFFYGIRFSVPELYKNRFVDDKCLDIYRSGVFLTLPKPVGEDGPRINCMRFGYYDTNKYNMADLMRVNSILSEIQIREDDHQNVAGVIEIIDFAGLKASSIFHFDIVLTKKMVVLGDKAWPSRGKGFHFINAPKSAERAILIAKSLMSEKMKKRFYLHSKIDSLYEHLPRDCLPKEYGGSNGTIDEILKNGEKKLLSYKQYFEEDVKYGTDENFTKSTPQFNPASLFGIDGSFRKLDID